MKKLLMGLLAFSVAGAAMAYDGPPRRYYGGPSYHRHAGPPPGYRRYYGPPPGYYRGYGHRPGYYRGYGPRRYGPPPRRYYY